MTLNELIKRINQEVPEYSVEEVARGEEERLVEKSIIHMMRDAKAKHDRILYNKTLNFYNDYLYIIGEI